MYYYIIMRFKLINPNIKGKGIKTHVNAKNASDAAVKLWGGFAGHLQNRLGKFNISIESSNNDISHFHVNETLNGDTVDFTLSRINNIPAEQEKKLLQSISQTGGKHRHSYDNKNVDSTDKSSEHSDSENKNNKQRAHHSDSENKHHKKHNEFENKNNKPHKKHKNKHNSSSSESSSSFDSSDDLSFSSYHIYQYPRNVYPVIELCDYYPLIYYINPLDFYKSYFTVPIWNVPEPPKMNVWLV